MLPKTNRLPPPDIKAVMRYGKRRACPNAILIYKTNAHGGPPRFACIVSAATDKRAAVRNRIKRLLRESIQRALPETVNGMEGIIIGRRGLIGATLSEVENMVRSLLQNT
ncbi:ribonuclease P protein component [Candidatus Gottesmanbacteria bacterium]|nr:ribonuclease P protein component [Candidatus Gottesmanbacteria bacterium]